MPSLQLLQLTEQGRSLFASRRKALLLTSGVLIASGTAAYVQSRHRYKKSEPFSQQNGIPDRESLNGAATDRWETRHKKKGLLKSLKILTAILLSKMGRLGARDLLSLVAIVVSVTFVDLLVKILRNVWQYG